MQRHLNYDGLWLDGHLQMQDVSRIIMTAREQGFSSFVFVTRGGKF